MLRVAGTFATVVALAAAAGCGSGGGSSSSSRSPSSSASGAASGAGLLTAEARSAATGDIPDSQVFITFTNAQARYSISSPEGWTRKGAGGDVTLADKNNLVHIVVLPGQSKPSAAALGAQLARLRASDPTVTFTPPSTIRISAGDAVKSTYTTRSAPNPVTGKQTVLIVDRYEFTGPGRRAIVDLGTARGVDNVDAYRRMINSFRWQ